MCIRDRHYIDYAKPKTLLIVAPKRVAETVWMQEAEKWGLTELAEKMIIVSGTKKQREKAIADAMKPYKIIGRDNLKDVIGYCCDILVPVSYTHLDVYKRQPPFHSPLARAHML